MGLQPSSHTPKLNQIEAGLSQPKNQSPVSGPICNHRASGQASRHTILRTTIYIDGLSTNKAIEARVIRLFVVSRS